MRGVVDEELVPVGAIEPISPIRVRGASSRPGEAVTVGHIEPIEPLEDGRGPYPGKPQPGVFVTLRLQVKGVSVRRPGGLEVVAKANTGYGAARPQLILPLGVARRLGWWPKVPKGTRTWKYEGAGSIPFVVYVVERGLSVSVVAPDRRMRAVVCDGVVTPGQGEVLMSAALVADAGIVVVDPSRGLWCFRSEMARRTRRSAPRQLW